MNCFAKGEILVFGFKNRNDIVGKTYAEKIRKEQVERKIKLYEIENESDKGNYWYTDVRDWDKFYDSREVPKKVLDIKQYVVIFNNTVSIINWADGEEVGLEIINSAYADMQKQFFWNFWEFAGKNI